MNSKQSFENIINDFQDKYWNENKKKSFFKGSQKFACAEETIKNFPLSELLENCIYSDEYKIIVNYPLIKTFINPNVYDNILNHFDTLVKNILINHNNFEIHVDMKSFTITAAQRFKELIKQFCSKYLNEKYEKIINGIYIYNSPSIISVMKTMFHPFISERNRTKIIIC